MQWRNSHISRWTFLMSYECQYGGYSSTPRHSPWPMASQAGWNLARNIVTLPKVGNLAPTNVHSDQTNAKANWSIRFLSFLLKSIERLVERKGISRKVLSGVPLHWNQHAYQPGASYEFVLYQAVGRIESFREKKLVFTFIDDVLDNTSFNTIVPKLRSEELALTYVGG